MRFLLLLLSIPLLAPAVFSTEWAAAQSPELPILTIRADKGGYLLGESATVTVANLTECAGQTVSIGFRDAARGGRFVEGPVTLDASGGGAVTVALMSLNGGNPVSPAAWADCVDRGLEPGLALDPFILLISISPATEAELLLLVPAGARSIATDLANGRLDEVIANLRPGTVIKTAYPGDGGAIATEVAANELRAALSGASGSDEFGAGRLGLLGVWEINGSHAILASTVQDGARVVVALGLSAANGDWVISSYGRVVLETGILETYALQHSVLLGNIGPLAPSVGNSPPIAPRLDVGMAAAAVVMVALAVVATLYRTHGHRES